VVVGAGHFDRPGTGIVGVSPSIKIMAVKGFLDNLNGVTDSFGLIESIYYAVNNGAKIINCSWGRSGLPTSVERDAFNYALSKGVTVVVAAGNSGADAQFFSPASIPGLIVVGATGQNDQIASFSNYGSRVDVLAPGGAGYVSGNMVDPIFSTYPQDLGSYTDLMGTSMASPIVAGVAALVLSIKPNFTPSDVMQIIKNSATPVRVVAANGVSYDSRRVDAAAAVALAEITQPSSQTTSTPTTCQGSNCATKSSESPAAKGAPLAGGGGCGTIQSVNSKRSSSGQKKWALFLLAPIFLNILVRYRGLKLFQLIGKR
jgi:subtilisin family serine protease